MASLDELKQRFDNAFNAGDYTTAYAIANGSGFNNNEIAGYVNDKFGTGVNAQQVGAYQTGIVPTASVPTTAAAAPSGTYDARDLMTMTGVSDLNAYRINSVPSSVYQSAAPTTIQGLQSARDAYWNSPDMTVQHMASPTWNTDVLALEKQQGVIDPKTGLRFVRSNADNNYRVLNKYGASVDNFEGLSAAADQQFVNRGYDPAILAKLRSGQFDNLNFESTAGLQDALQAYRNSGSGPQNNDTASGNVQGYTSGYAGQNLGLGGAAGGASGGFGNMPGFVPMQTGEAPINNPYLQSQLQNVMDMQNRNLQQSVFPALRSGAVGAGQYGGSRQGIAEGVATQGADLNTRSAMAGLLGGAYETAQNRMFDANKFNSANYGNQYQFNQNLANNVATNNLNRQLQGVTMGQNAYNLSNNAINSGMNLGNQMFQRPYDVLQRGANITSPIAGMGGTSSTTGTQNGNPYAGAVGGALAGYGLYQQFNQPAQQPTQQNFGIGQSSYQTPGYEAGDLGGGIRYSY